MINCLEDKESRLFCILSAVFFREKRITTTTTTNKIKNKGEVLVFDETNDERWNERMLSSSFMPRVKRGTIMYDNTDTHKHTQTHRD